MWISLGARALCNLVGNSDSSRRQFNYYSEMCRTDLETSFGVLTQALKLTVSFIGQLFHYHRAPGEVVLASNETAFNIAMYSTCIYTAYFDEAFLQSVVRQLRVRGFHKTEILRICCKLKEKIDT